MAERKLVAFTRMKDGAADRLLRELARQGEETLAGYRLTRLEHELQAATRARRHGVFQMVYYAHHHGWDRELRQKYADSPYYRACVDFCERWDQSSFDPDYAMDPLESFEAQLREVFARKAWDAAVIRPGVVTGLPALAA